MKPIWRAQFSSNSVWIPGTPLSTPEGCTAPANSYKFHCFHGLLLISLAAPLLQSQFSGVLCCLSRLPGSATWLLRRQTPKNKSCPPKERREGCLSLSSLSQVLAEQSPTAATEFFVVTFRASPSSGIFWFDLRRVLRFPAAFHVHISHPTSFGSDAPHKRDDSKRTLSLSAASAARLLSMETGFYIRNGQRTSDK
jgi:hypothetical protein